MSAKIVVAGAGHGGIAAAILLARKGYDVTLVEKQEEASLGYDWRDCIHMSCFTDTGLEPPPQDELEPMRNIHYYNPRKSVRIPPKTDYSTSSLFVERKALLRHLLSLAKESGVQLRFSCPARSAVTDGTRVVGLDLEDGGTLACDLLIDAAGMDSPVRKSLPPACGIEREITPEKTLFTYRALFEDTGEASDMPVYNAYFFHAGSQGFDWVIREGKVVDVLVGAFGSITPQIVENAIEDFRTDHPYLGKTLLRGGAYAKIPLRRTLPQFVCDGYVAIGDSAAMIEPLSGSGMTRSIRSAGFLSDVLDHVTTYSREELWAFEQAYFHRYLRSILHDVTLKDALIRMGEKNINAMFEKKILTQKEMYGGKQSPSDLWHKATGVLTSPSMIPALVQMLRRTKGETRLLRTLPHTYDAALVADWQRRYMAY